jgi:hypothetical protein
VRERGPRRIPRGDEHRLVRRRILRRVDVDGHAHEARVARALVCREDGRVENGAAAPEAVHVEAEYLAHLRRVEALEKGGRARARVAVARHGKDAGSGA